MTTFIIAFTFARLGAMVSFAQFHTFFGGAGAAFVGEAPVKFALHKQAVAEYKLAWRECEAKVREADANRVEHGHCTAVRKPREWKR